MIIMIQNELKDRLPEGWREKFVHRDCDQANYEFAMFEIDGENKILVRNPDTDDIMEYYYDDFDGKISIAGFIESMGYKEQDRRKYYIDREYNWYSNDKFKKNLLTDVKINRRNDYPEQGVFVITPSRGLDVLTFNIHRLIAYIFIPTKDSTYTIINHRDRDHKNFLKENLEWCDIEHNNSAKNKKPLEFIRLYRRLSDNRVFSPDELKSEYSYSNAAKMVRRAISYKTTYKDSSWEITNVALEDYLSRHPIDPNGWYDDNGLHDFGKHKVRANTCGVLEVDGKLTVGHRRESLCMYTITINKKAYLVHRLIYEILSNKLIKEGNVIDHIIPSDTKDVNNSYNNLREVTQKENMQNTATRVLLSNRICVFDVLGNLIETLDSGHIASVKYETAKSLVSRSRSGGLVKAGKYIFINPGEPIEERTNLLYYRMSPSGEVLACETIFGSSLFGRDPDRILLSKIRKYLNTGMAAPDGFYYQQGDPQNMICDPNNKDLIKKRPELNWKHRNKNREDT